MLQQFFKSNIETKFIKNVLENFSLPLYKAVDDYDYLVEEQKYIYHNNIIQCDRSGSLYGNLSDSLLYNTSISVDKIGQLYNFYKPYNISNIQELAYIFLKSAGLTVDNSKLLDTYLIGDNNYIYGIYYNYILIEDDSINYIIITDINGNRLTIKECLPHEVSQITNSLLDYNKIFGNSDIIQENIYVSISAFSCKYHILDNYAFNNNYLNVSQYSDSNTDYYDSDTHKYLGNYLRYLTKTTRIDLMPYYNCFDYELSTSYSYKYSEADNKYIIENYSDSSKILLTPIKFNTKYTVALNCPQGAIYQFVFYGKFGLLTKSMDSDNATYLHNNIENNNIIKTSFNFTKPITLECICDNYELQNYEDYLYLAIQVPHDNKSSFVVLEGEYSNTSKKSIINIEDKYTTASQLPIINKALFTKPELLQVNDKNIYAYSSRLIEYLLQNVIDSEDIYAKDITDIQSKFNSPFSGVYDIDLRYKVYSKINCNPKIEQVDLDGYINRNTAEYIKKEM